MWLKSGKSVQFWQAKIFCSFKKRWTAVGRIPLKISSRLSGFTADQWKNWVILYSLFCLKDILPWRDYQCWHHFVKVCFILCHRTISEEQLVQADVHLNDFWKSFTELYQKEACTPNMHLHGHLTACIRDFGPVYTFWCFAFERIEWMVYWEIIIQTIGTCLFSTWEDF